jgi:hypothetical protein
MAESGQSAKLIELPKEIAPRLRLAAVVRNPRGTGGPALFSVIQVAAGALGIEVRPIDAGDAGAIERGLAAVAHEQNADPALPKVGQEEPDTAEVEVTPEDGADPLGLVLFDEELLSRLT